jgi:hypothetical protein
MTSIYVIIFAIGNLEIGYVTGKGPATCARMDEISAVMTELWGEQPNAFCRDTGVPFLRPVARP